MSAGQQLLTVVGGAVVVWCLWRLLCVVFVVVELLRRWVFTVGLLLLVAWAVTRLLV